MSIELKDVIHLYLGCEVKTISEFPARLVWAGILGSEAQKYGTLVGGMSTTRHWEPENKLVLRPLSDMTEEEANAIWKILDWNEAIHPPHRIGDILSEFDTIERDDGTSENSHWGHLVKIMPYLLKQGFDLFGLIESGQAIQSSSEMDGRKVK